VRSARFDLLIINKPIKRGGRSARARNLAKNLLIKQTGLKNTKFMPCRPIQYGGPSEFSDKRDNQKFTNGVDDIICTFTTHTYINVILQALFRRFLFKITYNLYMNELIFTRRLA